MDKMDTTTNSQSQKLKGKLETGKVECLGRVNGGRKDDGCGWEMIWDGGEQLSWSPPENNEIDEMKEFGSTGGEKEEQMIGGAQWVWILGISPEGGKE